MLLVISLTKFYLLGQIHTVLQFFKMEFLTKILVFSALSVGIYCRSIEVERNISNYTEEDSYNNCSCNLRYLKHYDVKGCVVESEDSCGCPKKFACLFNNETLQTSSKVCIYQNKEYKIGSKIITSDNCRVCKCREGTPPFLSCINVECPTINNAEKNFKEKCHLVYSENRCCPTGLECVDNKNETELTNNEILTCEHNGVIYPLGAKIPQIDEPCQICLCNENWSGINNISCYEQECLFENNKARLDEGCIPIYQENKCCPIEFYCPSSHDSSFSVISSNDSTENNDTLDNNEACSFADQFYELGKELSIGNPCVKCSCLVPPDFTCVHKSCPPPPSYENCYPVYIQGGCCPKYECLFGDAEPLTDACPTPLCGDPTCYIGVPLYQKCPTCICRENGCPTPLCADSSCRIETPPDHECPTCVCNDRSSILEQNTIQQVQQVNQNINTIEDEFEGPRQVVSDYSEDELQMMPMRSQDSESESQSPAFEKMILSEPGEITQQLPEEINNDNSSEEREVNSTLESEQTIVNTTTLSSVISEPNNNSLESTSSESKKNIQKRSSTYYRVIAPIQQQNTFAQPGSFGINTEREFDSSDRNPNDFDDELESFRNKAFLNNGTAVNEITDLNAPEIVPPGCPTPMCEGSWCKIGILPGEFCPTCICRRVTNGEP